MPSIGALTKFSEVVQPWHKELQSKAVQSAAADLHAALAIAEAAKDAVSAIPEEQRAEEDALLAAARQDAETGDRRAPGARTEWDAELAYREQRWSLAHDAAGKAARKYRAVIASEAPKAVPSLIERAAKARADARPALLKAEQAIEKARAATSAVFAADEALGLQPAGWHLWPAEDRQIGNSVGIGVGHLLRWIDAAEQSELLSGRYATDTSDAVPDHTIRALAEGNEFAVQYVLANILHAAGRAEEIRDSTFTPDPDFAETHLDTKRLPN